MLSKKFEHYRASNSVYRIVALILIDICSMSLSVEELYLPLVERHSLVSCDVRLVTSLDRVTKVASQSFSRSQTK